MRFSVHPRRYDIDDARVDKAYGRHFTYGWQEVDTRSSDEFSQIITNRVWSPCIFKDGHRCIDSFTEARLLVLDFDHPGYTLAQATEEWRDTIHWIGTTKNHQREKNAIVCDRFRLIVPFAEAITSSEKYRYNYQRIARLYDTADQSTKDGGRLFFPCQKVVSVCLDGEPQAVAEIPVDELARTRRNTEIRDFQRANKIIPNRLRAAFELPIPSGRQSNVIYGASKELASYGFTQERLMAMFLASPTYAGKVLSASTIKKIEDSILNGIKASRREESSPQGG